MNTTNSNGRLAGKVAWVTGGARGLGAATALRLWQEGAFVLATDLAETPSDTLQEALASGSMIYRRQDVTDENGWERQAQALIEQTGRLDILVNNAGVCIPASIAEETLEGWRRTQSINLDGVFLGCQTAVRHMRSGSGSIINISSMQGIIADPRIPAYNASKGGVRQLTKSVALYCAQARNGIRVNSVHPGFILTEMVRQGFEAAEGPEQANAMLKQSEAVIPVGHMGEPLDIANGVLFLASDESKYMTASELLIDGGYIAQ